MLWTGQAPHLLFHTHTGALWGPHWVNQGTGTKALAKVTENLMTRRCSDRRSEALDKRDSQLGWTEQGGGRFHQATQDV